MRRHGLRERLEHQRRLTRRFVAQQRLARRASSATRMLEALGAWFVDETPGPVRFVPPLVMDDVVAEASLEPSSVVWDDDQRLVDPRAESVAGDTTANAEPVPPVPRPTMA